MAVEFADDPHVCIRHLVSSEEYTGVYGAHPTCHALVIDLGGFEVRAGFSSEAQPRLRHRNLVGIPKTKRDGAFVIVGDPVLETEYGRFKTRSPFDHNVLYQFELAEHSLDYIFRSVGVCGDHVPHPILLTETVCNPNYSRAQLSELIFENYGAPSVCYGVDALFAYHYNVQPSRNAAAALVVSSGWAATHGNGFDYSNTVFVLFTPPGGCFF